MILGGLWKYGAGFLAFVCIMLGIALAVEKRHSSKLEDRNAKLSAIVSDYNAKSKETQKQTERVITRYIRVDAPEADKRAREVERAPLPGECKTPSAVLQADL